jgi:hypothetical protein
MRVAHDGARQLKYLSCDCLAMASVTRDWWRPWLFEKLFLADLSWLSFSCRTRS